MTSNELRELFSDKFGTDPWPKTYEVDAETYGNACQTIFNHRIESLTIKRIGNEYWINVALGPNNGIMFKDVELILKDKGR
jgi:hypothetical protein